MNNDVLMTLSSKFERLYNRMLVLETNGKRANNNLRNDINTLKCELEKTNIILEKIYNKLR